VKFYKLSKIFYMHYTIIHNVAIFIRIAKVTSLYFIKNLQAVMLFFKAKY